MLAGYRCIGFRINAHKNIAMNSFVTYHVYHDVTVLVGEALRFAGGRKISGGDDK